jgi:hypothetical protein
LSLNTISHQGGFIMSDAPLFQHTDDQEAANAAPQAEQDVAVPVSGLLPGGMGGSAAVNSIPGVVPPGAGELDDTRDEDAPDGPMARFEQ